MNQTADILVYKIIDESVLNTLKSFSKTALK